MSHLARIPITDLTCADGACAALVAALADLRGVSDAYVAPDAKGLAVHVVGVSELDEGAISQTILGLGYSPGPAERVTLADDYSYEYLDAIRTSHLEPEAIASDRARVLRIAREAAGAFDTLQHVRKAVAVFGSARAQPADRYGDLARSVVEEISRADFSVITGGGPGLMAVASQAAWNARGRSIGLTIQLPHEQASNPWLHLDVPFNYFFLRKLAFVRYACAFVCLPGGFGTLDELFEALNLKVTEKVEPFPVILIGMEYWDGLATWLRDHVAAIGALSAEELDTFLITDDPVEVVDAITACHETLCRRIGLDVSGEFPP